MQPLSQTAPVHPVIDSLRSPCGLPMAVYLRYALIPDFLSKNPFSPSSLDRLHTSPSIPRTL